MFLPTRLSTMHKLLPAVRAGRSSIRTGKSSESRLRWSGVLEAPILGFRFAMRSLCSNRELGPLFLRAHPQEKVLAPIFEGVCSYLARFQAALACLLIVALAWSPPTRAYAVLSHEAIIDAAWESHIKPLILKKYAPATEEDLSRAQAYAYGGSIIQDMGYYPYCSPFFSDLTHYVRSGDFVQALLRDAQNLTEYGFALGALAHYSADTEGHRIGTNRAVAVLYPGLGKKYGDSVTYEDGKLAHVKTEFGFDVLEIAKERYAPDGYHDFIG